MINEPTTIGEYIPENWDNELVLTDWDEVKNELRNAQRPLNFGNYDHAPAYKKRNGLIDVIEFIENHNGYYIDREEAAELCDAPVFDGDVTQDNTYNYGGYLSNEVDFKIFRNVHAEVGDSEITYVYVRIHVGLDVRAGYTEGFFIKFDDDYEVDEWLAARCEIATVEYTSEDGERYIVGIDAEAVYDTVSLYDHQTNRGGEGYENLTDPDSIKSMVCEFLESIEVEYYDMTVEYD